jgi:hypothetical protein
MIVRDMSTVDIAEEIGNDAARDDDDVVVVVMVADEGTLSKKLLLMLLRMCLDLVVLQTPPTVLVGEEGEVKPFADDEDKRKIDAARLNIIIMY